MPKLANPYPGWIPPWVGSYGECMRQAYSCVAGKHPLRLPYIDAMKLPVEEFWDAWIQLSIAEGMMLADLLPEEGGPYTYPFHPTIHESVLWIAGVESKVDRTPGHATHVIVMRGNDFYWDSSPNHARTQRPTKIYWGQGCVAVKP